MERLTDQQALFFALLKAHHLPLPITEHVFARPRKWRFDYCWQAGRVALEVEGGIWTRGRHTRGAGYLADLEKYSEAAVRGWAVVRVTPDQLCTLPTIKLIERALSR